MSADDIDEKLRLLMIAILVIVNIPSLFMNGFDALFDIFLIGWGVYALFIVGRKRDEMANRVSLEWDMLFAQWL